MKIESLFQIKNPSKPNVLVEGPNMRLNDFILDQILAKPIYQDIEKVTIDIENDSLDELLAVLTESSLFAEQKIVIIKNPIFLTGKKQSFKKHELEQLEEILTQVDSLDNYIVIKADYDKLDQRKKISKLVNKNFAVIETKLKPFELTKLIKELSQVNQLQIDSQATKLLIERSSNNPDTILANFEKLVVASKGDAITIEDIEENIDRSLEENIFDILSLALTNRKKDSLAQLDDQFRRGTDPVQLTTVFVSQLTFIFQVKKMNRFLSEGDIVKELKVHPYRVKLALQQKIELRYLEALLKRLIGLEFGYKNGTYQGESIIKSFVLTI